LKNNENQDKLTYVNFKKVERYVIDTENSEIDIANFQLQIQSVLQGERG